MQTDSRRTLRELSHIAQVRWGMGLASWILVSSFTLGCSCDEEKKAPPPPAPAVAEEPKLPPGVDETLLEELRKASTACTVEEARKRVDCNGGDKNALILAFNKGERERLRALPTLAFALTEKDEKLNALSSAVLYGAFRTGLGPEAKPGAVEPALAEQLLKAAVSLPPSVGMQVMPAATHTSVLAGSLGKLVKALDSTVPVQVRTMAYRYLMVYGRLEGFETVRQLGSDPGAAVVLAAIESPRNMRDWSTAEQAAICPWAAQFLDDARAPVAGNAMAVLSNCSGKELDHLLDSLEKSLKEKQFSFIQATALRDICGTPQMRKEEKATDAQCKRVRALHANAAKSRDVQERVRAMVLSSLAHLWPDERTISLSKQLASGPESDLKKTAEQIVVRLERSSKKEK